MTNKTEAVAQGAAENEVQDTWLVGGPDLKAMSGSIESDRVLQLHFHRKVNDKDRAWLLEAINAKIAADQNSQSRAEIVIQDSIEAIIAGIGAADTAAEQALEIAHALGRAGFAITKFAQPPAEISTFNDTMPSSLNDACRRLDLAQEEIMKLRAQVESATAWLDQEITRAADQQRQSYAMSGEHGQRQGERWHARQIALYEAKLKLTSTMRQE
jgi:hypothetical protein